ncbi:MAG: hypothetical protein U0X20_17700 [Caldilineaceae bacterium]
MPAHRSVFSHVLCLALVCVIAAALAVVPVVPAAAAPPVTPPAPGRERRPRRWPPSALRLFSSRWPPLSPPRTAGLPTPAVATTYALAPAAGQASRVTATTTISLAAPPRPATPAGRALPSRASCRPAPRHQRRRQHDERDPGRRGRRALGVWEQYAYGREPRLYRRGDLALAPRLAAPVPQRP